MKHPKSKYGIQCACRYCEQDIEFWGRKTGWIDRGQGRECLPYKDRKTGEIASPKTKHAPYKG